MANGLLLQTQAGVPDGDDDDDDIGGIESVRSKNLAQASAVGAFRCKVPECGGREAIAHGMSSMGLETAASGGDRPAVVYECLTCGDRSTE